jgi:hypothetical protein
MRNNGLTRLDLIVAAIVVALTVALLLPALGASHATDKLTGCLNRTRGLSSELIKYAEDRAGILPPGKYAHQGGHPVPKVWMELLYEGGYLPNKADFQCPSDDVTDNEARYYDYGPAYPYWWASYAYAINLCDLYWFEHPPRATVLANLAGSFETQIMIGESECNFLNRLWFGRDDTDSFRPAYVQQYPFDRHGGFCLYAMLDGQAKAMRVPVSDAQDSTQFEAEIRAQFETCDVEVAGDQQHMCFWNRYQRGLGMTNPFNY